MRKGDGLDVSASTTLAGRGVVLDADVRAPMRDGVALAADVYRPAARGRYPVILMRVPYDKRYAQTNTFRHPSWYAEQGYVVVVQDTRGRYASGGEFHPFLTEAQDGYDTVEWAGALPYANGRVGMYGLSYAGATQLQAALMRPPSRRAICPGITSAQYYDGWAYRGGAFALAFNVFWATFLGYADARRSGRGGVADELARALGRTLSRCEHLPVTSVPMAGEAPYFAEWLAHPTYDDWWRRWSVDEDYARIDVPALHIGGWYDIFASGTVGNFRGLRDGAGSTRSRAAQRLLMGPWHHEIQASGSAQGHAADTDGVVDAWQLRWFDQFLRDADTGILEEPEACVYVLGAARWHRGTWPDRGKPERRLFLHSRGAANSRFGDGRLSLDEPKDEPPDVYAYDPLSPVPSAGGTSCCVPGLTPMGPAPQCAVELLRDVLVYTSEPLERALTVLGDVSLTLFVTSSVDDTDFTAKLCDVAPDGRSVNLVQGVLRARYRDGYDRPAPLEPFVVYELHIELGPVAAFFAPGHRIRLQVSSSDFPLWDRNLNVYADIAELGVSDAQTATQSVLHDSEHPSHLRLPVIEA
jgi:putative CocE/NonD family hydrolase